MSEYVRKQAVLEWLNKKCPTAWETMQAIKSGAFDTPDDEIQRLKVALDWVKRRFEEEWTYELGTGEVVEEIIVKFEEALSATEPTGAELVKCVICKTVAYPNGRWKKAHYGDVCPDCRSGRRIKAPEKVGTEEWRHKHINAYWAREGLIKHQEAEVQRLRAENERYRKALEKIAEIDIPYVPMTDHSVMRFYEQVAREALASTPTEPNKLRRMER
jgi:hypothetical protein